MTNSNFTKKGLALSVGMTAAALVSVAPAAEAASFNLNFDEGADGGSVLYNADGTLQLDQWETWGVTLSGHNNRTGNAAKLNTYDTGRRKANPTNYRYDQDLETGYVAGDENRYGSRGVNGTAAQGNVLIIQEEKSQNFGNGQWFEDDEGAGGKINFGFDSAISLTSFSMLDIDDNGHGIKVTATGADGGDDLVIDIDALINDHYAANGNSQGSIFTNNGVTITQVGAKRGDNSMYQFDLDQDFFAGRRFSDVEFKYPGSGAISGIEWNDGTPEEIPEPSVIGGLLMLGFVGARKYRKNKLSA